MRLPEHPNLTPKKIEIYCQVKAQIEYQRLVAEFFPHGSETQPTTRITRTELATLVCVSKQTLRKRLEDQGIEPDGKMPDKEDFFYVENVRHLYS